MRLSIAATLAVFLSATTVHASLLTCTDFRHRLTDAISEGGGKVAQADPFVQERDDPGIGKKFSWKGIVGLDGGLSCGPQNQFESFSAEIDTTDTNTYDKFQGVASRLVNLAAASVRALTSSPYSEAEKFAVTMFGAAVRGMKAEVDRGERMPAGMNDTYLYPEVDAEFAITPVGVSWLLGPQNGHSMDAARLPLVPELRDGTP